MFSFRLLPAVVILSASFLAPPAHLMGEDAALMVAPRELHAGGRSAVTVTTFDAESRAPAARPVAIQLLDNGERVSTLYVGGSGSSGHLRVAFDVPQLPPGLYTLQAQVGGLQEVLDIETTVSSAPAILIETDKPIYKPSQTIQGRVLLVDNALRPVAGEVELTFHDAKGIRIDRQTLEADSFGAQAFSLELASELNFGTWKIRAHSEGVESVRDIRVEEYTLPRFDLSVDFPRTWALVDEEIEGTVTARYFFGKDVEGSALVTATRWVGTWEEYARVEGEVSDGRLAFTLPAVGFVAGSPQNSGQGAVTVDVEVTDSTGHTQQISEVITITEASIVLGLIPRARSLKPAIPFEILVTARTPDGDPVDVPVETTATFFSNFGGVLTSVQEIVNVQGGSGPLTLVAPPETSYAQIVASAERDGRRTSTQIQVGGAYSQTGSFLSLSRDGDGVVRVGEALRFSAVSTHPGTVYYEVFAGGRTVLSDATESDTFSFAVSTEMIPSANVVAYKINPDNEVAADSLRLDVELETTIAIEASFDREQVKPGDPVELVIDAGTGHRTLIGLSVVDQSVLALGRSRLHLADVFAELERRFLEPQVEVHEQPGGPPEFEGDFLLPGGFGPPRTHGALDTLREAGLEIVATSNVSVPEGGVADWWGWAEDLDVAAGPPGENGAGSEPPDVVRVRQYFPETWVWEPLLLTDDEGRTSLTLTAPDSITGWKLAAVGSSPAGIGFGQGELTVFQDFFVEPSLPYSVTRGEEFPVKVDIFNYLESEQNIALSFGAGEWYEALGESQTEITVPPGSATAVHFPIRPSSVGDHIIELTARGSILSDAVRRTIRVVPEGIPTERVFNSIIEPGASARLDVTFPPAAVPGSTRAFLNVTPSPVAQTMSGVSDLLNMPYGCGEQNMIFLAPDIEILKYLREVGELNPEIRAEAEHFVNVGYQRELTFQSDDGGFSAFGGAEGSLWLTAFVLSTFAGAREVRDIDEDVLIRAAGMLASRQKEDGSFRTDDFLIHKEMDGGLENLFATTAYVTNALADYRAGGEYGGEEVRIALTRAADYLVSERSRVNDDAYSLSIAAGALLKVPDAEAEAEVVIDRLLDLATGDGVGIHWEPYPVETTGYAAMALLAVQGGVGRPEAAAAVDWLSTQRNSLGGYGTSTQDTVVAIRALFQAARKVRRDLDVQLELKADDEIIWTLHVDRSNFDLLHTVELPSASSADGENPTLELSSTGSGNVGYQVVKRYNLPGEMLPPARDMIIEVEYDSEGIEVDDILDVGVRLVYTGLKEATGMVIADIGIPTGFAVVRSSLDTLVDQETVSRVDVAGRKVIFYIDSLVKDEPMQFVFQMRSLYPVRAEGPVSRAYEYYDPEVQAYNRTPDVVVEISDPEEPMFVRGDASGDDVVDISDAVLTLGFLFLGGDAQARLRCQDAADANDDGAINITDPIYLLQHLFLGGLAPPPPYPERGLDSTDDGLECS